MMADLSPLVSHNNALRLGYRLRWVYLFLVVLGAIVWWGMYPGVVAWELVFDRRYNLVLYALDLVWFFWTIGTGEDFFSDNSGVYEIWGWPDRWDIWSSSQRTVKQWLWIIMGAFGIPVGLALSVLGFVGVTRRASERLPAKRRASWAAIVSASAAGALMLAAAGLIALHFSGLLEAWDDVWDDLRRFGRQIQSPPSVYDLFWPLNVYWLLITSSIPAALCLWLLIIRRDTFWQLERMTRVIGVGSAALLLFSWVAVASGYGPRDRYSDLNLEMWRTVCFSASTALLWAMVCRVWLLFRLVKYQKQRSLMMTESPVCFACDYDLSGSLRGGATRCPECGVAVPGEVVERFACGTMGPGKEHGGDDAGTALGE